MTYTRIEVASIHQNPQQQLFLCRVCGSTLETCATTSAIGYRMSTSQYDPFKESKKRKAENVVANELVPESRVSAD